jgi:hypothetical protein
MVDCRIGLHDLIVVAGRRSELGSLSKPLDGPIPEPWTPHTSSRRIARGCDSLGFTRHGPLRRNAPACDGQGS